MSDILVLVLFHGGGMFHLWGCGEGVVCRWGVETRGVSSLFVGSCDVKRRSPNALGIRGG